MISEIVNNHISQKLDTSVGMARLKIAVMYDEYRKNIIILAALSSLFLLAAIVASLVVPVRKAGIITAAVLLLVLGCRSLYLLIRYTRMIITYRHQIAEFCAYFIKKRSFQMAAKELIRNNWRARYAGMTNFFTAKIHSLCAGIGIVKSAWEIEDDITESYYRMIREYLIGNVMLKILIMLLLYGAYAFILQPLVVHSLLGMNFADILVYPVKSEHLHQQVLSYLHHMVLHLLPDG